MTVSRPLRIAIVAGEHSGDLLGAGLIRGLRVLHPDIECYGIGGAHMQAQGFTSLYPIERLAVMGLTEVLGRYRELRGMRNALRARLLQERPDAFVGIDSPDFNLGLEEPLRAAGIPTIHYVSPTVWAWRGYRIHRIRRAVEHMLTLFPFEARFYQQQGIAGTFVGHPMAIEIPETVDRDTARVRLHLPRSATIVALLPGSRARDLNAHADLFVATARWLHTRNPALQFVAPLIDAQQLQLFRAAIARQSADDLPIVCLQGQGREAMAAADAVLLKSGTAALEAMLLKRLMVVTYRTSAVSYFLIRLLSHVKLYSMPNHLAGRALAPELMQHDAVPAKLGAAIEACLRPSAHNDEVLQVYARLHRELRQNSNELAARAVLQLAQSSGEGRTEHETESAADRGRR